MAFIRSINATTTSQAQLGEDELGHFLAHGEGAPIMVEDPGSSTSGVTVGSATVNDPGGGGGASNLASKTSSKSPDVVRAQAIEHLRSAYKEYCDWQSETQQEFLDNAEPKEICHDVASFRERVLVWEERALGFDERTRTMDEEMHMLQMQQHEVAEAGQKRYLQSKYDIDNEIAEVCRRNLEFRAEQAAEEREGKSGDAGEGFVSQVEDQDEKTTKETGNGEEASTPVFEPPSVDVLKARQAELLLRLQYEVQRKQFELQELKDLVRRREICIKQIEARTKGFNDDLYKNFRMQQEEVAVPGMERGMVQFVSAGPTESAGAWAMMKELETRLDEVQITTAQYQEALATRQENCAWLEEALNRARDLSEKLRSAEELEPDSVDAEFQTALSAAALEAEVEAQRAEESSTAKQQQQLKNDLQEDVESVDAQQSSLRSGADDASITANGNHGEDASIGDDQGASMGVQQPALPTPNPANVSPHVYPTATPQRGTPQRRNTTAGGRASPSLTGSGRRNSARGSRLSGSGAPDYNFTPSSRATADTGMTRSGRVAAAATPSSSSAAPNPGKTTGAASDGRSGAAARGVSISHRSGQLARDAQGITAPNRSRKGSQKSSGGAQITFSPGKQAIRTGINNINTNLQKQQEEMSQFSRIGATRAAASTTPTGSVSGGGGRGASGGASQADASSFLSAAVTGRSPATKASARGPASARGGGYVVASSASGQRSPSQRARGITRSSAAMAGGGSFNSSGKGASLASSNGTSVRGGRLQSSAGASGSAPGVGTGPSTATEKLRPPRITADAAPTIPEDEEGQLSVPNSADDKPLERSFLSSGSDGDPRIDAIPSRPPPFQSSDDELFQSTASIRQSPAQYQQAKVPGSPKVQTMPNSTGKPVRASAHFVIQQPTLAVPASPGGRTRNILGAGPATASGQISSRAVQGSRVVQQVTAHPLTNFPRVSRSQVVVVGPATGGIHATSASSTAQHQQPSSPASTSSSHRLNSGDCLPPADASASPRKVSPTFGAVEQMDGSASAPVAPLRSTEPDRHVAKYLASGPSAGTPGDGKVSILERELRAVASGVTGVTPAKAGSTGKRGSMAGADARLTNRHREKTLSLGQVDSRRGRSRGSR